MFREVEEHDKWQMKLSAAPPGGIFAPLRQTAGYQSGIKKADPILVCLISPGNSLFQRACPALFSVSFSKCRCTMLCGIEMHGHPRSLINVNFAPLFTV
jgi:hypothetical protein